MTSAFFISGLIQGHSLLSGMQYTIVAEAIMTYTQPEIDKDFTIVPGEDILVMAKKMEAAGQMQVAKGIARLKAMGEPIHYMIGEKLVREEADGRKFEYRLQDDGTEEILGELPCTNLNLGS
jgi:hypothetical protein